MSDCKKTAPSASADGEHNPLLPPLPAAAAGLGQKPSAVATPPAGGYLPPPGASVAVPVHTHVQATPHPDAAFPLQLALFTAGFLIAPAWWVGACMGCCGRKFCDYEIMSRRERVFYHLNLVFSLVTTILYALGLIVYVGLMALVAQIPMNDALDSAGMRTSHLGGGPDMWEGGDDIWRHGP